MQWVWEALIFKWLHKLEKTIKRLTEHDKKSLFAREGSTDTALTLCIQQPLYARIRTQSGAYYSNKHADDTSFIAMQTQRNKRADDHAGRHRDTSERRFTRCCMQLQQISSVWPFRVQRSRWKSIVGFAPMFQPSLVATNSGFAFVVWRMPEAPFNCLQVKVESSQRLTDAYLGRGRGFSNATSRPSHTWVLDCTTDARQLWRPHAHHVTYRTGPVAWNEAASAPAANHHLLLPKPLPRPVPLWHGHYGRRRRIVS